MKNLIIATREYREKLLKDPYRPVYHFAQPDDNGFPGDSNGAFFVDGVYHLMYLYKNSKTDAYHWGHISSVDLLHWRHHPDALFTDEGDLGAFSGGAFVDDDKTAYLSFWKFPSKDYKGDNGGIALAYSKPPYDKWERIKPIAIEGDREKWGVLEKQFNGEIRHIACADPSNIWKENGFYYMQTGNKPVLDYYGRQEDSLEFYKGDFTDLFKSEDLKNWEYVDRFYDRDKRDENWPDDTEDDMCSSFLPLYDKKENGEKTGKYLQLFISHNRGCQYYVGEFKNEKFYPEVHGRMSWNDKAYFAPEALIDDKSRQILWTWLLDNLENDFETYGWSSVYGLPRVLWWEDQKLHIAPVTELDKLQYNKQTPTIKEDNSIIVNNGEVFRLKAIIDMRNQSKSGFTVRKDDTNQTDIYYDKEKNLLVFDASKSGKSKFAIKEEAPLCIDSDELKLDIFVDKSVVEVYANDIQAICRRVYPENPTEATGVSFIGDRNTVKKLEVFDMAPTNPY